MREAGILIMIPKLDLGEDATKEIIFYLTDVASAVPSLSHSDNTCLISLTYHTDTEGERGWERERERESEREWDRKWDKGREEIIKGTKTVRLWEIIMNEIG